MSSIQKVEKIINKIEEVIEKVVSVFAPQALPIVQAIEEITVALEEEEVNKYLDSNQPKSLPVDPSSNEVQ